MLVGDPTRFAIESGISKAYERLSYRGLGYFVIHLKTQRYGVYDPGATLLACSLNAVECRIREQGNHCAPFLTEFEAERVADAFLEAIYGETPAQSYFGMDTADFVSTIYSNDIQMAPDGDEAFDDGSYILQFDKEDEVRIIAFRRGEEGTYDTGTLSHISIPSEEFYGVLRRWRDSFIDDWTSQPKISEMT